MKQAPGRFRREMPNLTALLDLDAIPKAGDHWLTDVYQSSSVTKY